LAYRRLILDYTPIYWGEIWKRNIQL
jgi:hypothetical protein